MKEFYDIYVAAGGCRHDLRTLGWKGACFLSPEEGSEAGFETLSCEMVSGDVRKNAQKTLEGHDLAYFELATPEENRGASECWELDAFIASDEYVRNTRPGRKPLLDYVALKGMSERGIALIVPFRVVVARSGYLRATAIDCLRRTVYLARKAKVPVVLASGASEPEGLRAPLDLASFGVFLGMSEDDSVRAVSDNPRSVFEKARDRKNPDVILAGLTVVAWGSQKQTQKKRQFGWY